MRMCPNSVPSAITHGIVSVSPPLRQVAHVEVLHEVGLPAGHEDLAATHEPRGPRGEAVGGIARAHDGAGAHDDVALGESLARGLPARLAYASG